MAAFSTLLSEKWLCHEFVTNIDLIFGLHMYVLENCCKVLEKIKLSRCGEIEAATYVLHVLSKRKYLFHETFSLPTPVHTSRLDF